MRNVKIRDIFKNVVYTAYFSIYNYDAHGSISNQMCPLNKYGSGMNIIHYLSKAANSMIWQLLKLQFVLFFKIKIW